MTTDYQPNSEHKQAFLALLDEAQERAHTWTTEDCLHSAADTQFYDEYSKNLTKESTMLKAIEKLAMKLDRLNSQIESFHEKLQEDKKIDKLKQLYEDVEKKFETTKRRTDEIDRISDFLGFQVELKDDDLCTVQFTKLPIKDPEMKFTFDILDRQNKLKVLRCEPPQCLDTSEIESEMDLVEESSKFPKLILLIRHHLIEKYRN